MKNSAHRKILLGDLILVAVFFLLVFAFIEYGKQFLGHGVSCIDLSFHHLPSYTLLSLTRGLIAYVISLGVSLLVGYWAAKDRLAENIFIPLIDVLESIPILGFMPGAVLLFVSLFPHSHIGLELAAIVLIFTSQVWNMIFGVYHGIRTVPKEQEECAIIYALSSFQRFRLVELPHASISLVWNSIISMAGGWFFLMVSESFQIGDKDFRLPGIGSYMSVAASQGDILAMMLAVLFMMLLIVFLDQILWRPLVVWSQKFRSETDAGIKPMDSWFLRILQQSILLGYFYNGYKKIGSASFQRPRQVRSGQKFYIPRILLGFLLVLLVFVAIHLFFLVKDVPIHEWIYLGKMICLTFLRVLTCLVIGAFLALFLGLWIGLSSKKAKFFEPVLQITASFPATLLFPVLIWFFHLTGIPLGMGSIVLMLMGSFWYILFNVIAGVNAIPADFKEVAISFQLSAPQRLFKLYLPVIFPYLVTGLVSASGGAWNASIVAEYVRYHGKDWTTPGLGSFISLAAQEGNIALLVASILLMVIVVALINYQVWLKMYHYSEKRFTLG